MFNQVGIINLILGLALLLSLFGVPAQSATEDYSKRPMVIQLSSAGGTDKDIVIYSALPPFEILKEIPNMTRGTVTGTAAIPSSGKYAFFEGGASASWIIKIDLRNLEAKKIPIPGVDPVLTMTPDEKYVYVAAREGMISKIDAETDQILNFFTLDALREEGVWSDSVRGPGKASGVAMGPDGYLYLGTDTATAGTEASIWKIDTRDDTVAAVIPIPDRRTGPHMNYGTSKDGKFLYFGSLVGSYAAVVDTTKNEVIRVWDDGAGNHCSFGSPDGRYIWITNDGRFPTDKTQKALDRTYWVIDTQTNERVKILGPVPSMPHWVSFTPDGKLAATESRFSDLITIWDAKNLKKIKDIAVANRVQEKPIPTVKGQSQSEYALLGLSPDLSPTGTTGETTDKTKMVGVWHPRISPDGKYVYISINYLNANQVIDLEQGKVIKTIPVGPKPHQTILYWPGQPFVTGWWTHKPPIQQTSQSLR